MDRILKRDIAIRANLYSLLDDKNLTKEKLDKLQVSFGTKEWSDYSHNINDSKYACPNGCVYCYIKTYGENKPILPKDYKIKINKHKVRKIFYGYKRRSVIMFPSAHDIFDECVDYYITSAKNILNNGLDLLVVSKPRMSVIEKLCDKLKIYKKHVEFRFTVCTDNPKLKNIWEKYAPPIKERIECIKYVSKQGYRISISMEPLLSDPTNLIKLLDPYVFAFWVGYMNHVDNIDIEDIHKRNVLKLKDA